MNVENGETRVKNQDVDRSSEKNDTVSALYRTERNEIPKHGSSLITFK